MKPIKTLLTILFISLLSSPSWSVTLDDLVKRDDLYYEKFIDIPYTGEVTGSVQGAFKCGTGDGAWVFYHKNGRLSSKGAYKDGEADGTWLSYHENGQLRSVGDLKNFRPEGVWVAHNEDGTINKELTGTYKDGVKISD